MRVAILDDYFDTVRTLDCFALLDGHDVTVFNDHVVEVDALAERLGDADALVLIRERTAITAELLERLPRLRLISQRSVYPHVDVEACTRRGVVLCSDLHALTACHAAAELTWALVLAARREIPAQVASMRAGHWQCGVGRSLNGSTLGIYGYGRIGEVVAGYGRAFGMRLLAWGGESSRQRARADDVEVPASREEFFASSDVLTIHVRLVSATRGCVTAADLAAMRPDSLFVNTSRAGLVEDRRAGGRPAPRAPGRWRRWTSSIAEPLTDVHDELLALPNALCTPHIGYVTREEWDLQFAEIFAQVNDFATGHPRNAVNPEALAARDGARDRVTHDADDREAP